MVFITSTPQIFNNKLNISGDNLGKGNLNLASFSKLISLQSSASNVNGAAITSTIVSALSGKAINNTGTFKVTSNIPQKGIKFRYATVAGSLLIKTSLLIFLN